MSNHTNNDNTLPKKAELLRNEWLVTYTSQFELLWAQVIKLNSNLYILETISHFPFNVFMINDNLCWSLIACALYESCIMIIWRVVVDNDPASLGLRSFKNELLKNTQNTNAKNLILERLKSVDFDRRVGTAEKHIRKLRHSLFAHLDREVVSCAQAGGKGITIIPIDQLKTICDAINELIAAISFDTGRACIYMQYSKDVIHPIGTDSRPDIEKILDHLAQSSPLLSMPEQQPKYWERIRHVFTREEIEQYNIYRCKFGMASI